MYLSTDSYASGAKTTIRLEAAGGLYDDRGNLYSPLYYDKDNSSYYTDPAGTSNVRHITMRAAGELKMYRSDNAAYTTHDARNDGVIPTLHKFTIM